MEIIVAKKVTIEDFLAQVPQYEFNTRLNIQPKKKHYDASIFNECLYACKTNAQAVLEAHQKESPNKEQRLNDVEKSWLEHYIAVTTRDTYKVEENENAVYRKICSLRLAGPEGVGHALHFWQHLYDKKKITQELFEKQVATIAKLHLLFKRLEKEDIILRYPRVAPEIAGYQSFL